MRIRPGDAADQPAVLKLFDEAVEWLVARGSADSCGAERLDQGWWSGDGWAGEQAVVR